MGITTATAETTTLERTWGSIPLEHKEKILLLVKKRIFESESQAVRQAITDLLINYNLFLTPSEK